MAKLDGRRVLNGKHAKLFWDGEIILEVESFEAKAISNREEIDMVGSMDVDSKLISLTGEGTMTVKKVYSRGINKLLDAWKNGIDPRSTLTGLLNDPDAVGRQKERVTLNNVWFDEFVLIAFTVGEIGTGEFPFGFTVSDVDVQETIDW